MATERWRVGCLACGESKEWIIDPETEQVEVTVPHKHDCPFDRAVKKGEAKALKYVTKHGHCVVTEKVG